MFSTNKGKKMWMNNSVQLILSTYTSQSAWWNRVKGAKAFRVLRLQVTRSDGPRHEWMGTKAIKTKQKLSVTHSISCGPLDSSTDRWTCIRGIRTASCEATPSRTWPNKINKDHAASRWAWVEAKVISTQTCAALEMDVNVLVRSFPIAKIWKAPEAKTSTKSVSGKKKKKKKKDILLAKKQKTKTVACTDECRLTYWALTYSCTCAFRSGPVDQIDLPAWAIKWSKLKMKWNESSNGQTRFCRSI